MPSLVTPFLAFLIPSHFYSMIAISLRDENVHNCWIKHLWSTCISVNGMLLVTQPKQEMFVIYLIVPDVP
jgi:hypothetical protein